jgi:hypothetical protein
MSNALQHFAFPLLPQKSYWGRPYQEQSQSKAVLDTNQYETGVATPDEEIDELRLKRHKSSPKLELHPAAPQFMSRRRPIVYIIV